MKRKNPVVTVERWKFGVHVPGIHCAIEHKVWAKLTGLKLKPGECKAIRFSVEVIKDAN